MSWTTARATFGSANTTSPGRIGPPRSGPSFDPAGRVLGFVETPKDFAIFEIGEDYLLGTATDDLEVERVQLWPLERSGG